MLNEREIESCYLGQFIPVHYHHNMLMDQNRMNAFQAAIGHAVRPGMKVLELGGGTGVLSYFAAQQADKVYCVEFNPDLVKEARRFLAMNPNGHKVEVIHADAFDYLPPEPVDVVICEMIHVAMLREKQVAVIEAFKERYLARFGGPLPIFMPEAVVMAVQPLQQDYAFHGYYAPIVQFQDTTVAYPGTVELAQPAVYSVLDFAALVDSLIAWRGSFTVEQDGTLNALRFVTKNVLSIVQERGATIDWLNHYMTLPLAKALDVVAGDVVEVSFQYRAGGSIPSLQASIRATLAFDEVEAMPAVSMRTVEFA
ncbi:MULTISPECIES: methyltransferase domain-containing protein [unclassified Massilia]|uniref:methyltransferase domain-containing protein n=1 Tax=unclassified Massilia TaxID=2609279 RepID=UPI00177C75EE|nr:MULTISPECIES: methyltransferase domain-containing protein [unclassified Massilia]MBD8531898.1 methyltransferase domain-containing protein [Massilia sp. CFBP 13647]MBD8675343.1 methyltransferase domain-containing protein [Massilia sp. CFBP 13721]